MVRCHSLECQDVIPLYHSIHCRSCRNQVARLHDYIRMVWPGGIFTRLFNVLVPEKPYRQLLGTTVVNARCVRCGELIGWKIIEVTRQDMYVREGRFCMKLEKLSLWNDVPLLHLNGVPDLGANEENVDQDGDPNDQNVDQDGDTTDGGMTDGYTTETDTTDQDGDADEQVPNEQDEEDVEGIQFIVSHFLRHFICQTAYQGGGGNELNHDQDGGPNVQVPNEQDGDATDQDGDSTDQDAETTDRDEDATD